MARVVTVEAEVLEELPRLLYRLKTSAQSQIIGHPVGAAERNYVRLLKGDRVEVELSSDDPSRGRIVKKLSGKVGEGRNL